MLGRARRAAAGVALARREIIFRPVRMDEDLIAHQRYADEIIDLLFLDQPHRLFGVPFRHQDQLAPEREALEEHGDFRGAVEQRGAEIGREWCREGVWK